MKILSWNINGLRAVYKRGFLTWLAKSQAQIACFQEIKCQKSQLPQNLTALAGYYAYFNSAQKKGYSGVMVYSREKPVAVEKTLGLERFDKEGRWLQLEYPEFILINLYLPHGGRQKENLAYKLAVYTALFKKLAKIKNKKVIIIGDFNIAHQETDLARPKQNQKNIMFTPQERQQISQLINLGLVDTFRHFNQETGNFTWWPYFANARARNLGWRIDYAFVSQKLLPKLKKAFILPEVFGSDHCPIGIDIEIS